MSTTLTVGTVKRTAAILIAIAIVVAAGVVVGQAPVIFDAELDDPEASIEFEDQHGDGASVTVAAVSLSDGGFVVVSDATGEFVGVSEHLESGTHENVTVEQREDADLEMLGRLTATVHQDTTDDGNFAYEETDGEEDRPYLEDGYPVSDTASVTMAERPADEAEMDSFAVDAVDVPSEATTNETVTVTAELRNPTDHETRQHAELRIDGSLLERQVLSLEADESREVTFEVDGTDLGSGTHTLGVYTAEDGQQGEIEVEYDGPASVSVVATDPETETVTVDAGLPEGGFVGVVNETDDLVGTSDPLDDGEHENVTVDLEAEIDDLAEANLTAVAYEGDPADPGDASAYEVEGERVDAPVSFDEADDADPDDEAED